MRIISRRSADIDEHYTYTWSTMVGSVMIPDSYLLALVSFKFDVPQNAVDERMLLRQIP
ncbi:MAG: hypothetical protein ACLUTA_06330 [Blautia wexlerae]